MMHVLDETVCDYFDFACENYPRFLTHVTLFHTFSAIAVVAAIIALYFIKGTPFKVHTPRPKRSRGNELGSSDLANPTHVRRWFQKPAKLDTILYVSNVRGGTGIVVRKGQLTIPSKERNRHILFIAKTGGGKTTKAILPILYNDVLCPVRSTVVLDSKPEMWSKLAGLARKYNPAKKLLLFNPLDTARSLSWNIVSKVENDTDAKLIANTIIMATDNPQARQDTPFFRNNALQLLNALMVGLLNDPEERLSIPRVHELVHSGKNSLCDWLEAHPHALRNSRTFVELARSGSQNADTVLSELGMRMSAWDLTAIRKTTFMEELNLESLIQEPTLLVVELRESELEMLRPMANTIVVEILRFLTKRAEACPKATLPRPVGLVIDEFASALGRLPDIHVKLNTLRSRNVSIVGAIQSIAQIKANYGPDADSVLAGFNTKILMPMLDIQDAEWASKETGTMTVRFKTANSGLNKKIIENFANRNRGSQEQVQQRAVLTPDEVGHPLDGINTFFLPDTPVFQGHLVPYYQIPELNKRISESEASSEVSLREQPISYEEHLPEVSPQPGGQEATGGGSSPEIRELLEQAKKKLDWENTTGVAREWWEAFERQNAENLATVLMLCQELLIRQATITEFFLAYVYSDVDSVEENLRYLDAMREQRKKAEEEAPQEESSGDAQSELGEPASVMEEPLSFVEEDVQPEDSEQTLGQKMADITSR